MFRKAKKDVNKKGCANRPITVSGPTEVKECIQIRLRF